MGRDSPLARLTPRGPGCGTASPQVSSERPLGWVSPPMSPIDAAPPGPPSATPTELRERLLAEREGEPFLVWRNQDGRQALLTLHQGLTRVTIGRGPSNDVALGWDTEV